MTGILEKAALLHHNPFKVDSMRLAEVLSYLGLELNIGSILLHLWKPWNGQAACSELIG